MKEQIVFILFFSTAMTCWSQDTVKAKFHSQFHLDHDYRQYETELGESVDFIYNRFISGLPDGNYCFVDSISNLIRLMGEVKNSRLVKKWSYFDSLGQKRIEDVFFNDFDSNIHTSYYDESGFLYRTKEGSNKFLKTIHYTKKGMTDYYFNDFTDSSNLQMNFFENGQLKHRSSSKSGLNHGEYYWAYEDGTLYAQHFYKNGLKVETWRSGFKGLKEDWCTEKYETDRLTFISFRNGLSYKISSGTMEILDRYPSGKIRLKGKVVDGFKSGTWFFYDEKGNIIGEFHHDTRGNLTSWSIKSDSIPAI